MLGGGLVWGKKINVDAANGDAAFLDGTEYHVITTYIDIQGVSSLSIHAPHYSAMLYLDSQFKKIGRERFFDSTNGFVETTKTPPQGTCYIVWGPITPVAGVLSSYVYIGNASDGTTIFEYRPS